MFFDSASPPTGWTLSRLKDVARLNPEVLPETTDPSFEIQYVDIGNVSSDGRVLDTEVLAFADAPSRARRLVRSGDTIISTVRTYLRAVAYLAEPPTNLVVSTGFAVLRPLPVVHRPYLGWLVRSDPFVEAVMAKSQGVSYPAVAPQELANLSLWLPPVDQQRAIADYLDRETAEIDTLVGRRQRQAVSLNERSRVLVADQVTGGVGWEWPGPPNGGIAVGKAPPVGWFMRRLGRLLVRIEQGWSPQCENRPAGDGEWGVLKAGAVNSGTLDESENKALPAEVVPAVRYEVRPGDLLVSRANTRQLLGSTAIVGEVRPRLLVCDKLFRIEPRPMLDRNFLALALATPFARYQLERDATGASPSMQNIGQDSLKRLLLFLPPLDDQKEIVASSRTIAHQTRAQTRLLQQQVAKLQERRAALVTAGVTGQLDIPTV